MAFTHACDEDINVLPCLVLLSRIVYQGHLVKHHNDFYSWQKQDFLSGMANNLLLSGISGVE